MAVRLSRKDIKDLSELIKKLPEYADLLLEVKNSLFEAITLPKSEAIKYLRIRLEPAVLVNDDIAPKRDIYRVILKVLTLLGLDHELTPGVSIVETTIDTLFDQDNFTDVNIRAKELYKSHINGRSSGSTRADTSRVSYNQQDVRSSGNIQEGAGSRDMTSDSISKKLSSASYTFKDSSHRFSGDYDCQMSLYRFKQMVYATCDKYNIPERSRASILTDALEGQALDFYLDNIAGQAVTLSSAFESLEQRFDSPHSRAQAQSYLESLTLTSIRDAEQCTTAKALDIAINRISSIAPMCGNAFGHESHKSRWLANMLRQESWAQQ